MRFLEKKIWYFTIVFFVFATLLGWFGFFLNGIEMGDFSGQWVFCAYSLRGIDPFSLIGTGMAPIEQLGFVPSTFGTSPWGLFLGNFLYFGFLPLDVAKVCYFIFNIASAGVVSYFIAHYFTIMPKKLRFFFSALALGSADLAFAVNNGNAGGIICAYLMLACFIRQKHPVVSGILLGIAMTKPQTALLFCFVFLLCKNVIPVFTAAIIDLAAWLSASWIFGVSPWKVFTEFLFSNTGGESHYAGFFTMLRPYNTGSLMYVGMVVAVIMVFILWLLQKGYSEKEPLFEMLTPSVFCVCWAYAMGNDNYILLIPVLLSFLLALQMKEMRKQIFWIAAAFYFYTGSIFRTVVEMIFRYFGKTSNDWTLFIYTVYSFGLVFLCILMVLERKRMCEL